MLLNQKRRADGVDINPLLRLGETTSYTVFPRHCRLAPAAYGGLRTCHKVSSGSGAKLQWPVIGEPLD